jgi:hypothetical protein
MTPNEITELHTIITLFEALGKMPSQAMIMFKEADLNQRDVFTCV